VIHLFILLGRLETRSASFNASALNSAVYLLFVYWVGFLLMDHLWSNFTQFLSTLRVHAGQFLSLSFVVLLRKRFPQNRNLKTAA
jgi:hypothetical protein